MRVIPGLAQCELADGCASHTAERMFLYSITQVDLSSCVHAPRVSSIALHQCLLYFVHV